MILHKIKYNILFQAHQKTCTLDRTVDWIELIQVKVNNTLYFKLKFEIKKKKSLENSLEI